MSKLKTEFFVVTVVSNPLRFRRRYELYLRFKEMCASAGAKLITVELGFGDREFVVTDPRDADHLQVRCIDEFWHKENMIRLGIAHGRRRFPDAKGCAWVDADCRPAMMPSDWFYETWQALQHYQFVQMWEWIQDLDYDYNPIGQPGPSFMANYIKYGTPYPKGVNGQRVNPYQPGPISWGSPGLAWAANFDAMDQIGGLPDAAIVGAGDWYLAHMLTSEMELVDMDKYSPGYRDYWLTYQQRCEQWIKRDVGYLRGLVYHDFHGKKVNRRYNTRERILIDNQYDPYTDIKHDSQGLLQLETWSPRQIRIRDQLRAYFRQRNEDDIVA